jgi:transposase
VAGAGKTRLRYLPGQRDLIKEPGIRFDHANANVTDQRKIRKLEKRIKGIESKEEILKKATSLFMSDSMNNLR